MKFAQPNFCNCGGGGGRSAPAISQERRLPSSGEVEVWFYAPSIGSHWYATYAVSGRPVYLRHDVISNANAADAEWLIANPNSWPGGRPTDAILARRGQEYVVYRPSVSGTVQGQVVTYTFTPNVDKVVLQADLAAVQAQVPGTVL